MKTTTTKFHKKLKAYSALAGTFAAAAGSADAQVIYTDVMPDSTVVGGVYMLDLNNDDIADFKLEQRSGYTFGASYDAIAVYALAANNAIDTSGGSGTPSALDLGISVDSTLNWVDSTTAASIAPIPTANGIALIVPLFGVNEGNFHGEGEKFLPLRFENLGSTFYGWVRLDVAADAKSFKIIDYAYTDDPDHSTITGDMVGIAEAAMQDQINIFAFNNAVTVELNASAEIGGTIEIINISGQVIAKSTVTKASTVIPLENAKTGIYLVTVKQAHSSYTKRVFVK